jgi:hypothetical protein
MDGFFFIKNVIHLFGHLRSLYPQFISEFFSIGTTVQGKDIPAITIGLLSTPKKNSNQANRILDENPEVKSEEKSEEKPEETLEQKKRSLDDELSSSYQEHKSNILFTALHHSREPLTLSMIVYIFLINLHTLIHTNWETVVRSSKLFYEDLEDQVISEKFFLFGNFVFVPAVNLDSYMFINEAYGTPDFDLKKKKRKNMNMNNPCVKFKNQEITEKQKEVISGVDINRNYDIKFKQDNIGSVDDPCDETYRGKSK